MFHYLTTACVAQVSGYRHICKKLAIVLASAMCVLVFGRVVANELMITPEAGPWSSGIGFQFTKKPNKTRRSVSGIACGSGVAGDRHCLFVFDEGTQARFGILRQGSLEPHTDEIILTPGDGELDAEGAALDGESFYITGSHSSKRGTCESNPDSRYVIRLHLDPETGQAMRDVNGKISPDITRALWDLMSQQSALSPFVGEGKCLGTEPPENAPELKGQRGANIEALAVRAGRLFFGFRGPTIDKRVPILTVDAATLFDGTPANVTIAMLRVGQRRGIRDMQAVADGFLILVGPDDDRASDNAGWVIGHWDGLTSANGEATLRPLAQLNLDGQIRNQCDKEIKPEALTVWSESDNHYEVVIVSDGMCDGGPLLFHVPR